MLSLRPKTSAVAMAALLAISSFSPAIEPLRSITMATAALCFSSSSGALSRTGNVSSIGVR